MGQGMTKKRLKTYGRLMRITRQRIDQQRLFLSQIEGRLERVQGEIGRLQEHLAYEETISKESLEASIAFPPYAQKVKVTLDHLGRQQREITLQLAQEKEKMMTFFSDLKVYEVTKKNIEGQMDADENQADQEDLDEISQVRSKAGDHPLF